MGTAPSAKKRRAAKKRRNVSKHIVKAKEERVKLEKARDGEAIIPALAEAERELRAGDSAVNDSSITNNQHVKDIKEAANYLKLWQAKAGWKFNKNTQSWLVRHCYESDKVSKPSFAVLLEYLRGLRGARAKARIVEEATRRALRYKKYAGEGAADNDGMKEERTVMEQEKKSEINKVVQFSEDTKPEDGSKRKQKNTTAAAADEEKLWQNISDHEKRKEYKRARKILEALREQ